MDRVIWYYGETLRDTDLLNSARYPMVGLAKLSEAVLGGAQVVTGFAVAPTTPASLSVTLGAGQVYQQTNLESTAYSSFGPDTHTIVKQGVTLDAQTLTFVAPTTVGYAQNFLIEVQYVDIDGGATVLPYYNAANPAVPFSGPGNAGSSQNSVRQGGVAVQVKAGIAATSGTQVSPSPDSGWAGLYVVTMAQGQTTVTSGNIVQYAAAPFIPVTLPGVPNGVQAGQWTYAASAGTNGYTAALAPIPTGLFPGMEVLVFFGNANTSTTPTLNLNGLGAKSILRSNGGAPAAADLSGFISLIYGGANWLVNGLVTSDIVSIINTYANTSGGYVPIYAARTYYIDIVNGVDTNSGLTAGTAFRNFTAAYAAALRLNTNGNTVTFQFADATSTPHSAITASQPLFGGGMALCQGNVSSPISCYVVSNTGNAVTATGGAVLYVQGFTPYTGSSVNGCVVAQFGGQIHLVGPMVYVATPGNHIQASDNGQVRLGSGYTVNGGAAYHYVATNGGQVYQFTNVQVGVTFTANMTFTVFALAVTDGRMSLPTMAFNVQTYTITATRYQVATGGGILSSGSTTYFPGGTAGTVTSPGWYN